MSSTSSPSPARVRFAPSPTGLIHIGNVRTALFNWLFARHIGGTMILRIEDTDAARNTDEAVQLIYNTLGWLGINWDEGPGTGGEYGPYRQSERAEIYQRYLTKLEETGHVYEDQGAIRFRFSRKPVIVNDLIAGRIEFDRPLDPDMTIRRPDGSWIFHFVNVVDDIEMKITHVIRGEDHLSNAYKHVELYQALGAEPPTFAHIPLILNTNGSKMSKRDQGASATTYINEGYVPEAFVNYLCLLNWSPGDNREKVDLEEVVKLFDISKLSRGNAVFDTSKLFWLNGQYVRDMSAARFRELSLPWFGKAGVSLEGYPESYVDEVLGSVKEKIKLLKDVPVWTSSFFTDTYSFDDEAAQKVLHTPGASQHLATVAARLETIPAESWQEDTLEAAFKELAAQNGVKTGAIIHPARVALTGRTVGPSIYATLRILGREKVLARLRGAAPHFA